MWFWPAIHKHESAVLMSLLHELKGMLGETVANLRVCCKTPKGEAKEMSEVLAQYHWAAEAAAYLQPSCLVRKIKPNLFRPLWSGFLSFQIHY